jgi:hypothetical protein
MRMNYCKAFLTHFILLISATCKSQSGADTLYLNYLNTQIDSIQKQIAETLTLKDSLFYGTQKKNLNQVLSTSPFIKVDELQVQIKSDALISQERKINYLTGLAAILKNYHAAYAAEELSTDELPLLIIAFDKSVILDGNDRSLMSVLQTLAFKAARLFLGSFIYSNTATSEADRNSFIISISKKNPEHIFPALFAFPEIVSADSLLTQLAVKAPGELYTYSQAKNSGLGKRIHSSKDSLVQLIAQLADKKEGRLFFPFTGSLIRGEITIAEIKNSLSEKDPVKYYTLLIKTQIRYTEREMSGDTAIAASILTDKIRSYTLQNFVYTINGLHDRPDAERFKVIEKLTARELYYICVAGADELYTSSYLYIYKKLFKTPGNTDSYSLLQSVYFDRFKRFIKLAANFNTLTDFLSRMHKENAYQLMRRFAGGLQNSNSLEDAVDVADSYASITDETLKQLLLTEVQQNLQQFKKLDIKTGIITYELLNTLFSSLAPSAGTDISGVLGIPSVYETDIKTLKNPAGKIIIQEYFYGDRDGMIQFNNFVAKYRNSQWQFVAKKKWVEFHSKNGTAISIYANKPLDEITYQDVKAQDTLRAYLAGIQEEPSIIIHRGHSYFAKYTISHITPDTKIILLGSCGGYNNLKDITKAAPFIHIIASKQEGSGSIN